MFPYWIRKARKNEWDDIMQLAWRTFLQFEAGDYSEEGIRNFNDFITDYHLYQLFLQGDYPTFVATDRGKIIGLITLRNRTHVSLLFVDAAYHMKGVGRALMEAMFRFLKEEKKEDYITVNAAPYAVGFYHKLGFVDLGDECTTDGIRYTPMKHML